MDILNPEDLKNLEIKEDKSFKTQETRIIEVDWGIAKRMGNGKIYINKHLKEFNPKLYKYIIAHEQSHTNGPYNTQDLQEDLNVDFLTFKDKVEFCSKYPRALIHFSPIIITKDEVIDGKKINGEIAIDSLALFKYGILLAILCFILFWVI